MPPPTPTLKLTYLHPGAIMVKGRKNHRLRSSSINCYVRKMKEKLDNKNIELAKILFELKKNVDLFKILTVNADNIKKRGRGKTFFAHIHRLALQSFIVNICKIFELEKKFELNSIHGILNYIESNKIASINGESIDKFIEKYGENQEPNQDYIMILRKTCEHFYQKNIKGLKKYDYARDKNMVHAEFGAERRNLPSYAEMENFLNFGIDFYSMISNAYMGIFPHEIQIDAQLFSSTLFVLEKFGIEGIKKDFEN